ncbi:MAG: bifunctional oligoribonuclease/PAP phosphatase NrnA [Phycisphaerae bacterium]
MPNESLMAAFARGREAVAAARRIVLFTHERADGDAVGSVAALQHVLRLEGRNAHGVLMEHLSSKYAFTARDEPLLFWGDDGVDDLTKRADLWILLDTAAQKQLAPLAARLQDRTARLLIVDHHATRDIRGDVEIIDETASATALLVAEWCRAEEWALSPTAARLLLMGLATDTGWFRHAGADARTFKSAARLISQGADPSALYDQLFLREPPERFGLFAAVNHAMVLEAGGRLAVLQVTNDLMQRCGATAGMAEDLVSEPLRIKQVAATVLLTETNTPAIRASFRGKPGVDVARVAESFGGGGHRLAAGARLPGPMAAAREQVVRAMTEALAQSTREPGG